MRAKAYSSRQKSHRPSQSLLRRLLGTFKRSERVSPMGGGASSKALGKSSQGLWSRKLVSGGRRRGRSPGAPKGRTHLKPPPFGLEDIPESVGAVSPIPSPTSPPVAPPFGGRASPSGTAAGAEVRGGVSSEMGVRYLETGEGAGDGKSLPRMRRVIAELADACFVDAARHMGEAHAGDCADLRTACNDAACLVREGQGCFGSQLSCGALATRAFEFLSEPKPGAAGVPGDLCDAFPELNKIIHTVCSVLLASLSEETASRIQAALADTLGMFLSETVGYSIDRLAAIPCLDAVSKGSLFSLRLRGCSEVTCMKLLPVTVSRDDTFDDLMKSCPMNSPEAAPHHLFPTFETDFGAEEGQGNGPRRECVQLASAQWLRKWNRVRTDACSVPLLLIGAASGGTSLVEVTSPVDLSRVVKIGAALQFSEGGSTLTGRYLTIASVEEAGFVAAVDGGSHFRMMVRTNVISEVDVKGALSVFHRRVALFELNRRTGSSWFTQQPPLAVNEPAGLRRAYRFSGWLIGTALANRCTLGVSLPTFLFSKLREEIVDPEKTYALPQSLPKREDLASIDSSLADSVTAIEAMDDATFEAFVRLELDDKAAMPTRETYISSLIKDRLVDGVRWQLEEMRCGFRNALGDWAWSLLRDLHIGASDLRDIVCGPGQCPDMKLRSHFMCVADEEFQNCDVLRDCFWKVVDGLDANETSRLLRFFTGVGQMPNAPEIMRIEMPLIAFCAEDHLKHFQMLPQAHTCTNTIELPVRVVCLMTSHETRCLFTLRLLPLLVELLGGPGFHSCGHY